MYINFWYAAAMSSEVRDEPVHVRLLGQSFVLFRDSAGKVHCLSNVCIHRGASLAGGKVKGDNIQCPYHGWQFDGEGRCRKIPSLGPDAKIPSRARVDSYPTEERYGFVFAFLGDLPAAERPPILEIPEWDREGWRCVSYTVDWDVHFQRSVENSLDAPHVDFVHDFGALSNSSFKLEPERSVVEEKGAWSAVHLIDTARQHFEHGYTGASHTWTWLWFGMGEKAPKFLFYTFTTPVDEHHVRRFLVHARNTQLEPSFDVTLAKGNEVAEREDRVVVEKLEPRVSPVDTTHEFLVADDAIMVRYRQRLVEWEEKGWRIDTDTVERNARKVAYAIPSPARREGGSWVLESIPLRPARSATAAVSRTP